MGGVALVASKANDEQKQDRQQQLQDQAVSKKQKSPLRASRNTLVCLMRPKYFCHDPPEIRDISTATTLWYAVLGNASSQYLPLNATAKQLSLQFPSCLDQFVDLFFTRAYDVHPTGRPILAEIDNKKQFLVDFVAFMLKRSVSEDEVARLVQAHQAIGVRSTDYGVLGEVLFHTLRVVLGQQFNAGVSHAWTKIYSQMFSIVLPVALAIELTDSWAKQLSHAMAESDIYRGLRSSPTSPTSVTHHSSH